MRNDLAIILFCVLTLSLVGCDQGGLEQAELPQAQLTPLKLIFPQPEPGEQDVEVILTVEHLGGSDLIIAQIELTEFDLQSELSVVDQDDWVGSRVTEGEQALIRLKWTPLDQRPDRALVTLMTNIGELVAEVTTPDLDAMLEVSSFGRGDFGSSNGSISIEGVAPRRKGTLGLQVTSVGLAPLHLTRLCFIDSEGNCLFNSNQDIGADETEETEMENTEMEPTETGEDSTATFILCQSIDGNGCSPIMFPDELIPRASYSFGVRYLAPDRDRDRRVARILIESDSVDAPQYVIEISATPCVRGVTAEECAGCGDGIVQEGESCDDGNEIDEDECKTDCTENVCGDGVVWSEVEECDDSNTNDEDACLSTCVAARCGDGFIWEEMEQCDDGNQEDGDECPSTCQTSICGDGLVNLNEECDDGNQVDTDACLSSCVVASCGDGVIWEGVETCDDQNTNNNDECLNTCQRATCGDGYLWQGTEACDDGDEDNQDRCLVGCILATCGDGFVWEGVEGCDDGNQENGDGCSSECQSARCGDGIVEVGVEECDAGDEVDGRCAYGVETCQTCDMTCRLIDSTGPYCGDNLIEEGLEDCDDGNRETESCPYGQGACQVCSLGCLLIDGAPTFCGDGILNGEEECDGQEGCLDDCRIGLNAADCVPYCPELDWVQLSGLSFTMGWSGGEEGERPEHPAQVSGFDILQSEVTVRQYQACVDEGVCETPRDRNDNMNCNWGVLSRIDHPINCVTWSQARTFARWVGGDLPSEVQWERAARGADGTSLYPWGEEEATCERAIIAEERTGCGFTQTWDVCSKPLGHSPEGVCDLIGNVWEWTLDAYSPYSVGLQGELPRCQMANCEGSPTERVLRGGGWTAYTPGWRATIREGYSPSLALNFFGFRCVRATPQ